MIYESSAKVDVVKERKTKIVCIRVCHGNAGKEHRDHISSDNVPTALIFRFGFVMSQVTFPLEIGPDSTMEAGSISGGKA